jgi:hypothetical protein
MTTPLTGTVALITGEGGTGLRDGELYLCRSCANRFWSALCAQGWTIHPVTSGEEES